MLEVHTRRSGDTVWQVTEVTYGRGERGERVAGLICGDNRHICLLMCHLHLSLHLTVITPSPSRHVFLACGLRPERKHAAGTQPITYAMA